MFRTLSILLALLTGMVPARAVDNTVVLTPGAGVTLRSRDVGSGVESLQQILGDTSGNALATAPGTGNAAFALPVQGVAGGVPQPGSFAAGALSAGAGVDGWDLTQGAKADAACGTSGGTCSIAALIKYLNAQASAIATSAATTATNTGAAIPPQSATVPIGGFGLCDGANGATNPCTTAVTVKAASTAAVATDKAMVVSIIPGATTGLGASGTPMRIDPTGTTTQPVNTAQVNGVTVLTGTGATGTGAQRVTVSTDQATNAGAALVKGGVGVVNGGSFYQHIAASQTAAVLQSSTGAAGDYLSHCVIYPSTTAAGSVTVFDNTNAAGTNVIEFSTGTLSNLAPISIPVGAVSVSGAWKVTTGANETVVCYGKFS
jgi:hypothetical protein